MPEHWPALTVRQPWAFGIEHGKSVENRGREMKYRGPLWIHAGARSRWDTAGGQSPLVRAAWQRFVRGIPGWPGLSATDVALGRRTTLMAFGAVIAAVQVTGCHDSRRCQQPPLTRFALPTFCTPWAAYDQWHIELSGIRSLAEPVPCRGMLGLWRLPEDVESAARAQLAGDVAATQAGESAS